MNSNRNIFEHLNSESESSNFSGIIDRPPRETEFSKVAETPTSENKNIFESLDEQKEGEKFGFLDTARDIAEQVASKGISGIGGAYGNILETFGLQSKEGQQLPGQQVRNDLQSDILDKLNRGETPSLGELMMLSDDDILPESSRLPTSKGIQEGIEGLTGVSKGKTTAGRIAGRGAEFVGEGLALPGGGAKALASLAGAGVAGQSLREAGAPEGVASAVEIVGSILPSAISKKLVPGSAKSKEIVDAGRKLGLSEAQITPLIQGESKISTLSKVARKGTKTKELFSSIKDSLGDAYKNIKSSVSNAGPISNNSQQKLLNGFSDVYSDLQKTLKPSPDKQAALDFIYDTIDRLNKNGTTPEELINFWQDINKSVKWNSIQGGKKSLARLKEPILEVLTDVAPQAAKDFEMANSLYSKFSQISKKLKPDIVDSIINKGEILALGPSAVAFMTGNPWAFAGLASESAIRTLGREMLINPYFQNIANKLVTNFNAGSVKGITESTKQVKEYFERKHPEEDWSFLIED